MGAQGGTGTSEPPDKMRGTGRFGRGAGQLAEAPMVEDGKAEESDEGIGRRVDLRWRRS